MPDENGHLTHWTVPDMPWKARVDSTLAQVAEHVDGMTQEMRDDCLTNNVLGAWADQVVQDMVQHADQAMMALAPGQECEDCESDECLRDEDEAHSR
jgi:hypothetical protein